METHAQKFNVGDLVKIKWSSVRFIVLEASWLRNSTMYEYTLYSPNINDLIYAKEILIDKIE